MKFLDLMVTVMIQQKVAMVIQHFTFNTTDLDNPSCADVQKQSCDTWSLTFGMSTITHSIHLFIFLVVIHLEKNTVTVVLDKGLLYES